MQFLEVAPIHMTSWCGTRMTYALEAYSLLTKLLVPVHDIMLSLNIRREEKDLLFIAGNIYTLHLLSDVQDEFQNNYHHRVDKSSNFDTKIYKIANETARKMSKILIPETDKFTRNLMFHVKGNLMVNVELHGKKHFLI